MAGLDREQTERSTVRPFRRPLPLPRAPPPRTPTHTAPCVQALLTEKAKQVRDDRLAPLAPLIPLDAICAAPAVHNAE